MVPVKCETLMWVKIGDKCFYDHANGNSYFSFRIGDIWGISLDCGEDKDDWCKEYGNTVCCHEFRIEETEYIKSIIENAREEYLADGVKHRIIVVHNPFTQQLEPPFDIEKEIYSQRCKLLKETITLSERVLFSAKMVLNVILSVTIKNSF